MGSELRDGGHFEKLADPKKFSSEQAAQFACKLTAFSNKDLVSSVSLSSILLRQKFRYGLDFCEGQSMCLPKELDGLPVLAVHIEVVPNRRSS